MRVGLEAADAVLLRKLRYRVPFHRGERLKLAPHRSAPDEADLSAVKTWVRSAKRPTAIDLFCGAGGLSLGLANAGFTVLVGADSDPLCVETHKANLGGLAYQGDLSDPQDFVHHLRAWGIESVDLIAGGVPCQPFSLAGRSKINSLVRANGRSARDPRAQLWYSFVDIVKLLQPRAVLLENVPGLAEWDEGSVLVGFCENLQELGYRTDAQVLDAHRHGVPQHRARLFIVGLRDGGGFDWPTPRRGPSPTVRDAIGDLPLIDGGQRNERLRYGHRRSTSWLQRRLRRKLPSADRNWIWDHITREVRPDDLRAFALLRPGKTYKELPASLQRYRDDIFTDKYNRLSWNDLSRSITAHIAKDGYWYIHPAQDRTLSVREAARIQTFPDRFRFAGEPTHRYRQIGNAVPPLLAEAIGRRLITSIRESSPKRMAAIASGSFRDDLLTWHSANTRTFPWRATDVSPWQVLMAEMCLHRTRADQVRPVFERLSRVAPTPKDMIDRTEEAREAMESLGLSWRVNNIVQVAQVLTETYDGQVPANRTELLQLPGVGDYVANAVLSFGFGRSAILMDTNTMRIVSRVMGRPQTKVWQLRLDLYRLAGRPGADPSFNYALLDLGATVCKANRPVCKACPVAHHCVYGRAETGARLVG